MNIRKSFATVIFLSLFLLYFPLNALAQPASVQNSSSDATAPALKIDPLHNLAL